MGLAAAQRSGALLHPGGERSGHVLVLSLEETEEDQVVAMDPVVVVVVYERYAAHGAAAAARQEELPAGVLPERVLALVQQFLLRHAQRRHPVGVVAVLAVRVVDELAELCPRADALYVDHVAGLAR